MADSIYTPLDKESNKIRIAIQHPQTKKYQGIYCSPQYVFLEEVGRESLKRGADMGMSGYVTTYGAVRAYF